jgi:hypothetical protein
MKKKLAGAGLAFCMFAFCSPVSNAWPRDTGPCYGYGCPSLGANNKPYEAKVTKDRKAKKDKDNDAQSAANQQTGASTPSTDTK